MGIKKTMSGSKIVNILFIGATTLWNKGTSAILIGAYNALKSIIPNARFVSLSILPTYTHHFPKDIVIVEDKIASQKNIFFFGFRFFYYLLWALLVRYFKLNLAIFDKQILEKYLEADIILEVSGERLTDQFSLYSYAQYLLRIIVGLILRKPVVVYGQSIGPFEKRFSRFLSRIILNRVKLITLRDDASLCHLKNINVKNPCIYLTADPAFLLEPAPYEEVRKILLEDGIDLESYKPNLIGICASKSVITLNPSQFKGEEERYYKIYVKMMSNLIDYLISKFNVNVILIPHGKISYPPGIDDDVATNRDIFERIKWKDKVIRIERDFSSSEIKAIISQCSLFIGSRMHANIAAISTGVPTVAISYRFKFKEIMKSVGQEEYVWEFNENSNFSKLISIINKAYSNKEIIRNELTSRFEEIKKKSLRNAILVKRLLDTLEGVKN
jgi:polysaccharide pyruvyl transferase WcaK-like protein